MAALVQSISDYNDVSEEWYLGEQGRRLDRVIDVLRQERAEAPWIEFGALAGGFAAMCADALGHKRDQMWCCDFAAKPLERAAERGFKTCFWDLEGQPRPAELKPRTFQTVLFCEIIEHLLAPDRSLPNVVDLLAPGGLLLLTTPNLASLGNRIRLLRGKTPSLGAAPGAAVKARDSLAAFDHLRVCTPDEWTTLLESLGLKVMRLEGATAAPREAGATLRRRFSLGLNTLLERLPGQLWQITLIVARKP
jgi:SAM-dependent methyltransferase